MDTVTTVLLVHGGLWQDEIDAEFFWDRTGVLAGLREHTDVLAVERPKRAGSWGVEGAWLAELVITPTLQPWL